MAMLLHRARRLPPFLFLAIAIVVTNADAKLLLWPHSNHEDSPRNKNAQEDEIVSGRLNLFHNRYDAAAPDPVRAGWPGYLTSPAKYLDVVVHYLRIRVREMVEYLTTDQFSRPTSPSAYALFRHAHQTDKFSEPKNALEGLVASFVAMRTGYLGGMHSLVDGAYELGYGMVSACVSLLSWDSASAADHSRPYHFLSELFRGLRSGAYHAADGVYLFVAGVVVGARNLMLGIYRTPESVRASREGKIYYPKGRAHDDHQRQKEGYAVWDYYSLDHEDVEIRMKEADLKGQRSSPDDRKMKTDERRRGDVQRIRRRHGVSVRDRKYYDILGVATNADQKDIRSAYRKEALKRHPDKLNAMQFPDSANDTSPKEPHIEGFLDLTQAYRVLSNDASRQAYDQHGVCFREEAKLPEEVSRQDYVDLLDELFGASAAADYVGNILIEPIVNAMLGIIGYHDDGESPDLQTLQQRRRTVDIAKYLRARTKAYTAGELGTEDFANSCRKEANIILEKGGEPAALILRIIGRTLSEEADQHVRRLLPFVRKSLSDSSQKVKASIANAKVYGPIYVRATLKGLVLGFLPDGQGGDHKDCTGGQKHTKEHVDQDAILNLLWLYVVNDVVTTLRKACEKVFADHDEGDSNLAFVQNPSFVKDQRTKRAGALRILAREMVAVSDEVSGRNWEQ